MKLTNPGAHIIDSRDRFAAARKQTEKDRVTRPDGFARMLGNASADLAGKFTDPKGAA